MTYKDRPSSQTQASILSDLINPLRGQQGTVALFTYKAWRKAADPKLGPGVQDTLEATQPENLGSRDFEHSRQ